MTIATTTDAGVPAAAGPITEPPADLAAWVSEASHAQQMANGLVDSFFVPAAYKVDVARNASADEYNRARAVAVANATGAILLGRSLGVDPLTSLQQIYVIHGRPGMYAKFKVALATRAGAEIWTEEQTDETVTVCGRAKGSEHVERVTITIEQAKKAGWLSNANYGKTPQDMLWARAAGRIADRVASQALFGLQSVEDIDDEPPAPAVAAPRVDTAALLAQPATPAAEVTWNAEDGTRVNGEHVPPTPEQLAAARAEQSATDVTVLPEAPTPEQPAAPEKIARATVSDIRGRLTEIGFTSVPERMRVAVHFAKRPDGAPAVAALNELTAEEGRRIVSALAEAAGTPDPRQTLEDWLLEPQTDGEADRG